MMLVSLIFRIAFVADLLNVLTCSMNHHTTGPEHLMSTVEKKTCFHHNVKLEDVQQYRACVMCTYWLKIPP